MLKLFTGVPGAGKTLNAIKHVVDQTKPGGAWEGRPVYYFNIPEVTIPGWQELSEERIAKWFTLPPGSIVIIDECQQLYPPKDWKDGAEEGIDRLDTHRHSGFDLVIITQHPKLIHAKVRRMVGEHWHFDRKHGMNQSTRYIWCSCEDDPKNFHAQQNGQAEVIRFDKKIFGYYKSAEVHTHKRKFPKRLVLALLFLASIPVLAFIVYNTFELGTAPPDYEEEEREESSDIGSALNPLNRLASLGSKDRYDYEEQLEPRLSGWPHTAPIYDDLREPVTYPKYNCVDFPMRISKCKCYTQQGTLLSTVPQSVCKLIVAEGFFDHALSDGGDSGYGGNDHVAGQSQNNGGGYTPGQNEVQAAAARIGSDQPIRRAILIEYDGPSRLRTGNNSGP